MQNNQKNRTLTKNQHTKSMADLHVKGMGTDLSISDTNTRPSTRASVNDGYSDVESIDGNGKKKLTRFVEELSKTKIKNKMGGGKPEEKYAHVAKEILKLIDTNINDYFQENKDDFFSVVKSKMGTSIGGKEAIKDDKTWREEFNKVFQSSPKGKNFLGILETNGVDTKTLAEEKLTLQQQIEKDKEVQDELKLEVEKAMQQLKTASDVNNILTNKASDLETKLNKERGEKEELEVEKQKKNSEIEELQTKMRDREGKSGTEKSELQATIEVLTAEKLQLQNQQIEKEKLSQTELLKAEKLRNDQLKAEVARKDQLIAEEKLAAEQNRAELEKANSQQQGTIYNLSKKLEEAKNQPDQQSQQKDITFQPDSAKDKISGRAKEIGKSVADNLFIIAAMIGTIMALMSGAGLAVIIVAAVTPIAGMMVKKGIDMIADQIERSQKNKEREQILEVNQGEYGIKMQKQPYESLQDKEFNGSEMDDRYSEQEPEFDSVSADNSNNDGEFHEDVESNNDIESQITIATSMKSVDHDNDMADIDEIVKEINKERIVDIKEKDLRRTVQEKFDLYIPQGKISQIDPEKKHSKIEGLDLYGGDVNPRIDNLPITDLEKEKDALKKEMEGYFPTLKTSEQVNASEIKSDGGINVDDIKIDINLNKNANQQDIELIDIESKDGKIRGFLKDKEKLEKQKNEFKEKAKSFNDRIVQSSQAIEAADQKEKNTQIEIESLKKQMEKAGITTESEKTTGMFGIGKTNRETQLKENLAALDLKISAVEAAKEYDFEKSKEPKEGRSKEYYDAKIQMHTEEIEKLMNEKTSLNMKNDEQNNLKNKKQKEEERLKNINESKKKLNDEYQKLRIEIIKLQQEENKIANKEREEEKGIDNRKEEIKKKAQEDAAKQKLQDEKKAEALANKQRQAKQKEEEKLKVIQKKKEEERQKKLANLKKQKAEAYNEAYKKTGKLSKTEQKAAERELESKLWDKDHAAIRSQERKASQHELLEVLINVDEIYSSRASDKHSAKSFVVDANQSPSSGTASQIQ